MNKSNILRSFVGINGQQDLVKQVIEKIFAPAGSSDESSYFPSYLPLEHAHISMWVAQAMDPTAIWLVYPFDMPQTRSKTEVEHLRDMKKILAYVDENLIKSTNQPNGEMSSGAWGFEEYLKARCMQLASKPGSELMEDAACKAWVKLPVSALKSSVRDDVSDTFCRINNKEHAGSSECACYWTDAGNGELWQDVLGKANYDAEKDPNDEKDRMKRTYPAFCYLKLCQNRGLQTQKMVADLAKACPDCLSINSVQGNTAGKITQTNSCEVKIESKSSAPSSVEQPKSSNAPTIAPTLIDSSVEQPKSSNAPTIAPTLIDSSATPSDLSNAQSHNSAQQGLIISLVSAWLLCGCLVAVATIVVLFYYTSVFAKSNSKF
jgi:hypothetical protein